MNRCKKCNLSQPEIEVYSYYEVRCSARIWSSFARCPVCGNRTSWVVGYSGKDVAMKSQQLWQESNQAK